MNLKCLIIVLGFFSACKAEKNTVRVDKYLTRDGFHSKRLVNKILQTNLYDERLNLIEENEYSRVGCNLVDSTIYNYNLNNQLIDKKHFTPIEVLENCKSKFGLRDHIKYIYDSKGELTGQEALKGVSLEKINSSTKENKSNVLKVKDSLMLLKDYLSDIDFIVNKTTPDNIESRIVKSVNIRSYHINGIPSILMDYGIPINEFLTVVVAHVENKKLVKDEFKFKNYWLIRSYSYKNNILDKVTIETINKSDNSKAVSTETFIVTVN